MLSVGIANIHTLTSEGLATFPNPTVSFPATSREVASDPGVCSDGIYFRPITHKHTRQVYQL